MKKNAWVYLCGFYGAVWGISLPLVAVCFFAGAVLVLTNGMSRGHATLAVLLMGIAVFLGTYCYTLRDRFYAWGKFGEEGLFFRVLFAPKRYQRYDRYGDAGICQYIHGDMDDENARKLLWIYLTVEAMRPLYLRNINRMPISLTTIRLPYTEDRFSWLILVLPEGLSDKMRMSRARLFSDINTSKK